MTTLRIALAPLRELSADSLLASAWLDRQGQVTELAPQTFAQLAKSAMGKPVELFLHPADSVIASLDLPPLNPARLNAAARCAAQAMILGSLDSMHLVNSPRDGAAQVHLSWLPHAQLDTLGRLLQLARVKLRGLYPAAYALALPDDGQPVLSGFEGHLLVRQSVDQAQVHPVVDDALSHWLGAGEPLHWIGSDAPDSAVVKVLPASQRWAGKAPGWGLHVGWQSARTATQDRWGRALACCAVALVVCLTGLNLYAKRQASEGAALKSAMNQRVRQAFPELPVILNPLQQARQQITARQSGGEIDPTRRFEHLVHQAGLAMPFMVGNLQEMTFDQDTLELQILNDSPRLRTDAGWQSTLQQAGIQVTSSDTGWTLREGGDKQVLEADSVAGAGHE